MQLAQSTADRWINLRKTDSVSSRSRPAGECIYTGPGRIRQPRMPTSRRLQQLESFKHVYAPIAGVVTRRNTDVGSLITAGSAGQGRELFDVAQVDPLRVFVSVPQTNAPSIRPGFAGIT